MATSYVRVLRLAPAALAAALLVACNLSIDDGPADVASDAGPRADAAAGADAGAADAALADANAADAAAPDAVVADAGAEVDGGVIPSPFPRLSCADVTTGTCLQFTAAESDQLIVALNELGDDTTLVLGMGTFALNNALTVRGAAGVSLLGQGIDATVLDFSSMTVQANGVDVVGDRFTIEQLTIVDSKKDGLRVEASTDVAIRFVRVTWSGGALTTNGAYGLYPVRCTNVLMEDSEVYHAADAGLYVGQSINVVVRRNVARRNVAGLEIENTQYADVYENTVEDNAGGLLVFDLPGNPVIGRDIRIHHNRVRHNNHPNFAPRGTTVSAIPKGTGTFALASRRVEIADNEYASNDTTDIAILSGLAVFGSTRAWALDVGAVRGSTVGLDLPTVGSTVMNYATNEVWIHGNTHSGSGTAPDGLSPDDRPLGALLLLVYGLSGSLLPVDSILYDGIGETVSPASPSLNTNSNHVCVGDELGATWATLDLPNLAARVSANQSVSPAHLYRPSAPFAPFDCRGLTAGDVRPVVLPF